jgi:hypothetical protein
VTSGKADGFIAAGGQVDPHENRTIGHVGSGRYSFGTVDKLDRAEKPLNWVEMKLGCKALHSFKARNLDIPNSGAMQGNNFLMKFACWPLNPLLLLCSTIV